MPVLLDRFKHVPELQLIRARCMKCAVSNAIMVWDLCRTDPNICCGCVEPLWRESTQGVARVMGDTGQELAEFYEMLVALEKKRCQVN